MLQFFTDGWPSEISLSITATATDGTGANTSAWTHSGGSDSCDGLDWQIGGIFVEVLNFEEAKRHRDTKAMKQATENMSGFIHELRREQGMKASRRFGKARY